MVGEISAVALKKIIAAKKSPGFSLSITTKPAHHIMASVATVTLPLPALPSGWAADKDFKAVGKLSEATQRSIEPVGPHFLAHARRARHKRTFSEDDRIQAQESAKNVEDGDVSDESEPEDPMMLQREAKDWKVSDRSSVYSLALLLTPFVSRPRTITRFSASPSTDGRPLKTRSRRPTARRFSSTTLIRRLLRVVSTTISSSSVSRRLPTSSLTLQSAANSTPSMRRLRSSPLLRSSSRRPTIIRLGAKSSSQRLDSPRLTPSPHLAVPTPPRSRSRNSTTSGTTSIAGEHSSTLTRMSLTTTRTVTRSDIRSARTPTLARRERPRTTLVSASC